MVGAVGKLAASRLAIAADGDAGLAPGVLQLAAHGRAVTFIVGGAQFGIGFAVGGIHLLPQALRHAVGHVRPLVFGLARVHGVAALRAAALAVLQAAQAEADKHAPVAAGGRVGVAVVVLLPYAGTAGHAELAPAVGTAVAGLPGAAALGFAARAQRIRRQPWQQALQGILVKARQRLCRAPGLAARIAHVGTAARQRQRHRATERVAAAQAVPAVMLEAAGIAAHALLVQIPRRTPAVRQLMLLAAAAITATQHAEGAAQILGRELAAHVQPQFAIAETGDVGHACGQRQVARQWKADTCLQHALAVTAGAAALVALPALHEPLQARIGPVTALVERCILTAHQHAVFVDAQGDAVAAHRETAGIQLIDAGLQIEAAR
ncbi:hypothetical protein G6F31_014211 [Rhizopus arrhizus]|nr:hypothetical protein G6F31_014211 [Rhizopus arrhizus]